MLLNDLYMHYQDDLVNYAKKPPSGPQVTVIGGGTGLSTLLRGLKLYSHNLTAVVSVADNGGSSGLLRKDLGILPPGDIRNCILALADTEPLMSDLINYRFIDGSLEGQNFGNLFLAAMSAVCDNNFYEAIRNFSNVLAVTGTVLPVSLANINISAVLTNGDVIEGESSIGERDDAAEH
ncbi:MAG TPA: YvcK family protein, partial [Clostridiaceae bacterium]|nr:YvcK family protein [Clostridiaceae bacterium]